MEKLRSQNYFHNSKDRISHFRRVHVSNLVSTDDLRQELREKNSKETLPLIFASTYNAGEILKETLPQSLNFSPDSFVILGFQEQSKLLEKKIESVVSNSFAENKSLILEVTIAH